MKIEFEYGSVNDTTGSDPNKNNYWSIKNLTLILIAVIIFVCMVAYFPTSNGIAISNAAVSHSSISHGAMSKHTISADELNINCTNSTSKLIGLLNEIETNGVDDVVTNWMSIHASLFSPNFTDYEFTLFAEWFEMHGLKTFTETDMTGSDISLTLEGDDGLIVVLNVVFDADCRILSISLVSVSDYALFIRDLTQFVQAYGRDDLYARMKRTRSSVKSIYKRT